MVDQVVTRETISITATNFTEADKALSAEYNALVFKAFRVANRYLSFGPEHARLAVVKTLLTSASRISALDSKEEIKASRTELLTALQKMKAPEELPVITATTNPAAPYSHEPSTPAPILSPPAETLVGDPDDQDDGS